MAVLDDCNRTLVLLGEFPLDEGEEGTLLHILVARSLRGSSRQHEETEGGTPPSPPAEEELVDTLHVQGGPCNQQLAGNLVGFH